MTGGIVKAFKNACNNYGLDGFPALFMPHIEQHSHMGRSLKEALDKLAVQVYEKPNGTTFILAKPKSADSPDKKLQNFLMEIEYFSPQLLVGATSLAYGRGFEMTDINAAYFCKTVAHWINPKHTDELTETVKSVIRNRMFANYRVEHDGKNLDLYSGHLTQWIVDAPSRTRKVSDFFAPLRTPMQLRIYGE